MELKIRPLAADEIPFDLLYLADPSEEAVSDYLRRGTCYGGFREGAIVGEYVLLPTRPFTAELVNLAVKEEFQNRGIGKELIRHAVETAREQGYKTLELGTGNAGIGQMALYQKCGFTITHVDLGFFRRHYPEPFSENGIECPDMIRMRMDL